MRSELMEKLISYIETQHPIIYINTFDTLQVDEIIVKACEQATNHNVRFMEFNNAMGIVDFRTKSPVKEYTLEEFLLYAMDEPYEGDDIVVIIKDVYDDLNNTRVIALLKRMAENILTREGYSLTIFLVGCRSVIPQEIEHYVTIFDIPLPDEKKIREIMSSFSENFGVKINKAVCDDIVLSLKGLNNYQIEQVLKLSYHDDGKIDSADKAFILGVKEQLIKKAGMLELVNFSEDFNQIGGLDNLKAWLKQKAKIFNNLDKAMKFGVDVPKGVMIIGMPGCGKSMTAKATAKIFNVPLVRLDVGRLMGKYVGESEHNMRKALSLAEAISPCVLWIDEIEKAFAGVGERGGASDVATRLFGHFLTWMQEKETTVFVVATANRINNIPPEFLRKGRFDDVFFVDLPNPEERKNIFEIHLKKRRKFSDKIDLEQLSQKTNGYNGADIESVVKEDIEWAFVHNKDSLSTESLIRSINKTKPISEVLKTAIDDIKETVKNLKIKHANK